MNMRKYIERVAILLALVMVGFGSVYAQEAGDMAVGLNIVYTPNWVDYTEVRWVYESDNGVKQMSKPYTANGGFGAKIQYNVTNPIRVEAAFAFLPSGFELGMWNLSVNANYLIPILEKLIVYPIAGLDFMKYTSEGEKFVLFDRTLIVSLDAGNFTLFGVNIGGGTEFRLSKKISLQGELRYIIGFDNSVFSDYHKTNRCMISIGAVYKFSKKGKKV